MSYEHRSAPNSAQRELRRADGAPIRAVVVDDEESLTEVISTALRYEGWDVRVAHDGQQGLSVIREFRPDVVVLDVMTVSYTHLDVYKRQSPPSRAAACFLQPRRRSCRPRAASNR